VVRADDDRVALAEEVEHDGEHGHVLRVPKSLWPPRAVTATSSNQAKAVLLPHPFLRKFVDGGPFELRESRGDRVGEFAGRPGQPLAFGPS
jgi:hypothetical protein